MPTILFTAPYMIPSLDRFRPVLDRYSLELIVPEVRERMEEDELLKYAGRFDGAICGDDRYTLQVIEACLPRLKVISKWGTGIDSIDAEACSRYGIKLGRTLNAFTTPVADFGHDEFKTITVKDWAETVKEGDHVGGGK